MTGLVCFFLKELSFQQFWGNTLALLSGVGFAGLTLFMRKQKNDNPIDSVLLGNVITFIVCAPSYHNGVTYDPITWAYITFLGFFQLGLAYVLYSIAIKRVSALDAIIYPVIEPILNPILALMFIGEKMTSTAKFGGLLVILGVVGREVLKEYFSVKENPSDEGFS